MVSIRWENSAADSTFHLLNAKGNFVFLDGYVGGNTLFFNSEVLSSQVLISLVKRSDIGVTSTIDKLSGILIERGHASVKLNISSLVQKMLTHFNMKNCKTARTSLPNGTNLRFGKMDLLDKNIVKWQFIGSLLHLATTVRSDISFAVNYLSRYLSQLYINFGLQQSMYRDI